MANLSLHPSSHNDWSKEWASNHSWANQALRKTALWTLKERGTSLLSEKDTEYKLEPHSNPFSCHMEKSA